MMMLDDNRIHVISPTAATTVRTFRSQAPSPVFVENPNDRPLEARLVDRVVESEEISVHCQLARHRCKRQKMNHDEPIFNRATGHSFHFQFGCHSREDLQEEEPAANAAAAAAASMIKHDTTDAFAGSKSFRSKAPPAIQIDQPSDRSPTGNTPVLDLPLVFYQRKGEIEIHNYDNGFAHPAASLNQNDAANTMFSNLWEHYQSPIHFHTVTPLCHQQERDDNDETSSAAKPSSPRVMATLSPYRVATPHSRVDDSPR